MLERPPPRLRRLVFGLTFLGVLPFLFAPAPYAWYPYLQDPASCDPPTKQDPEHCKCEAAPLYNGEVGTVYIGNTPFAKWCRHSAYFTGNVFEETRQSGTGYYVNESCLSLRDGEFDNLKSPISGVVTVPKCYNRFNVPVNPVLFVSFSPNPKPLIYGKSPTGSVVEVQAQMARSNGKFSSVSYSDSSSTTPVMQTGNPLTSGSWTIISKFMPSET